MTGAFRSEASAVSSVVGTVLMLGVTVTVFAGISLGVLAYFDAQPEPPRADLEAASAGTTYLLEHAGGESIDLDDGSIWANVNGLEYEIPLTDFATQVADGERWHVGESLCVSGPSPPCYFDELEVEGAFVVAGGSVIVTEGDRGIPLTCPSDTTGPDVASWVQLPADLDTHSVGAVAITATASDLCPGADDDEAPTLRYRFNDGSNPSYLSAAMTLAGAGTWQGSIPSQTWADLGGLTMEYYVQDMEDLLGNEADSAVQSDLVTELAVITYPSTHVDTSGSVTNFAGAQSSTDSGAQATLLEGATGSTGTVTLAASSNNGGWTNSGNAYASDNAWATTTSGAGATVSFGLADPGSSPGLIQTVVLRAEVQITTWTNDGFRFQGCLSSTCVQSALLQPTSSSELTLSYDITNLRPGGGSWSWTDIANLEFRVTNEKQNAADGTWRIDHAYVQVAHAATYSMDLRLDWAAVPVGATYQLQVNHLVSGDTFSMQLWDGATWTTRATLSSTTLTTTTYTLTGAEYNGGAPRVRFIDTTSQGTAQGNLSIGYIRVVTP